jgi:SNF2 family DNA or RNA helicase
VIKNARTQTFQAVCQLSSQFRLSLTGTPLENHLNELWSHFHFLMPELLGDMQDFESELTAASSDYRYLHRIKKKIRPFILRRKKEEVAKDLPERVEQTVWIEMSPPQRQLYNDFLGGVRSGLLKKIELEGASKHRMEILEAILRLRQICCHPLLVLKEEPDPSALVSSKLEMLLQDMETLIEEGKKILIYSQFTSMLKLIAKEINNGSTTDREKIVEKFQSDPQIPLFLISLKAGGIGLNLTQADYVIIYDPWWNEAAENQAIDRAHRIGRKDTVFAKRYVTLETIEEKIMSLKSHKRTLIGEVMEDSWDMDNFSITSQDLMNLLG